jgi:hypothetical protein
MGEIRSTYRKMRSEYKTLVEPGKKRDGNVKE